MRLKCVFLLVFCCALLAPAGDVYTIGDTVGDWGAPNPYAMYPRGPGYIRLSLLFDTLLWKDADSKAPEPALAEGCEVSEDGLVYTLRIRHGVTWHDGKPFGPDDVLFTVTYMQDHPSAWFDLSVVAACDRVGDNVVLRLSKPHAPFLMNTLAAMPILPRHIWQDVKDPRSFQTPESFIGTGPYRLADYSKAHGSYRFTAFDSYYGGNPRFREIRFIKLAPATTSAALLGRRVNAAPVMPELVSMLKQNLTIVEEPPIWLAKLMINHREAPLDDTRVRRALALAIDYDKLVRLGCRGHAIAGCPGLIPPANTAWHNPKTATPEHDPKRARAVLEGMELELLVNDSSARLGELLRGDLTAAGVTVNLRSVSPETLDVRVGEWTFQLAVSGHGGLGGDADILRRVIGQGGFNSARFTADTELTSLLDRQLHAIDRKTRRQLIFAIQERYATQMPAIPLFHKKGYWAHDGSVPLAYTPGGVAIGIPIPLNKSLFIRP